MCCIARDKTVNIFADLWFCHATGAFWKLRRSFTTFGHYIALQGLVVSPLDALLLLLLKAITLLTGLLRRLLNNLGSFSLCTCVSSSCAIAYEKFLPDAGTATCSASMMLLGTVPSGWFLMGNQLSHVLFFIFWLHSYTWKDIVVVKLLQTGLFLGPMWKLPGASSRPRTHRGGGGGRLPAISMHLWLARGELNVRQFLSSQKQHRELRKAVGAAVPLSGQFHPFQPGEFVWLKRFHRKTLDPTWEGPFQIWLTTRASVLLEGRNSWIHHSR